MSEFESNEERNTEELLKVLQSISYWAHLTNLTSEMCYEVMEYTAEGSNYSWIAYNEWNFFKLRPIDQEKWTSIKSKLRNNSLNISDIEGTDLGRLVDYIEDECNSNVNKFPALLAELSSLPEVINGPIYCFCDTMCLFALSEEEIKRIAGERISVSTKWEEFSLDQLENYVDLYEEDGPEIPFVCFED